MLAAVETKSDEEDRQAAAGDRMVERGNSFEGHDFMRNLEAHGEVQRVGIQDFELMKVLGRGAFGKVMQVRKKDTGKIYAMKILKKAAIVARNQVEHTRAERKILQLMSHPFLMTLRYAFQSKDKLYLVLDYYMGGELFFHLKNEKRFKEEVAKIYVAEIAMAFGYLHSNGVIYRDLKPENILLDERGHVCLTDFGLAKEMGEGEKTDTFCGTPEYLAPEIILSAGHDKAVDWWSLGILLYELTVGIPPFYSPNVDEMYKKIRNGPLRFPPFLTQECKQMIIGLLNRDAQQRLGSKNDFDDLKAEPFFADLDWDQLYQKQTEVAFKPKVDGLTDTSNFDEEFLSEDVIDSVVPPSAMNNLVHGNDEFSDFTYKGGGGFL